MNDDELAELWEKIFASTNSEEEADEHVRRAMLQSDAEPETATSPLDATAMHAIDALSMGMGGRPGKGSGYQGSEGGRQMLSLEDQQAREMSADDRAFAVETARQEHPGPSRAGASLALGVGGAGKGLMAVGRGVGAAGRGAVGLVKSGVQAAKRFGPGALKLAGKTAVNYAKAPFQPILDAMESAGRSGSVPKARGYSSTGSTAPSKPQAHRVGVSKGVPKNTPKRGNPSDGLDSPKAKKLAEELNRLLAEHMAKGA